MTPRTTIPYLLLLTEVYVQLTQTERDWRIHEQRAPLTTQIVASHYPVVIQRYSMVWGKRLMVRG